MRKIVLTLAAFAALGLAVPTFATSPAEAETVVVVKKKHRDHGRHLGWRKHRHHGWHEKRHHRHHRHHRHDERVIIR